MREILFRGKRVDNGEWVYGYFVNCSGVSEIIEVDCERWGIGEYHPIQVHQVIPETVGQFTGFVDTTGKKIFEGDIVAELGCRDRMIICYVEGSFCCKLESNPNYSISLNDSNGDWLPNITAIVGTIHDTAGKENIR